MATSPSKTHTLEEFVSTGKESTSLNYYKTSILAGDSIVHYSMDNVVYDYIDELKELAETVVLSEAMYSKYKYDGVYLLAHFLYGNRDLAFIILLLNGIYDSKQFDKRKIKLIRKDILMSFLNEVYNAEKEYIQRNRTSMGIKE